MGTELAAVIPALVALISGLAGGYITGRRQAKLEYTKWIRSRADDHERESRLAVAELTRALGAATHSMGWLTWGAENRAKYVTRDDVQRYDQEMHQLLPAITGCLAVVSALNEHFFRQMEPLVKQVYKLDVRIALATTEFLEQPAKGISLLGEFAEEVRVLSETLNRRVADIIRGQEHVLVSADAVGPRVTGGAPS